MGSYTLKGHPEVGVPEDCRYVIQTLPQRVVVDEGTTAGGPFNVNLEPGRYVALIVKEWPGVEGGPMTQFRHSETFYHEVSEAKWKELQNMHPKFARARQTTKGVMFLCGFVGCKKQLFSEFAMLKHECEHQGIDIMADNAKLKVAFVKPDPSQISTEPGASDALKQVRDRARAGA